jgi:hypothetical protein
LGQTSAPNIRPEASLDTSTGAWLSQSGTWHNNSDRRAKENITPVDGREILAQLVEIPVTTWNYKVDEPSVRHIGPMAQDFYATFKLGNSDTSIATLDADGVALAAIQGLYEISEEQRQQLASLQQHNQELATRLAALEAQVAALTEAQNGGQ